VHSRRFSILLVTSGIPRKGETPRIGLSKSSFDDSEFVDYVELLSASNFSFDIITPEKISFETFFAENLVRYSAVIFATPLSCLSDSMLSIFKRASYEFGVSLISSYIYVDQRSKSFFGIQTILGKKYLWPLKVKIIQWPRDLYAGNPVANYGLGVSTSGVRKRSLRKLSFKQTFLKGIRLVQNLLILYARVELETDANILATNMRSEPIAWSFQFGKATNYYIALHGGLFLDKFNEMHRLFRAVIEANSGFGMASVDLENAMVLRLDDPGACSADYCKSGRILEDEDWGELCRILENKGIPLSVMYTPGWVDDGDGQSGTLFIDGKEIIHRRAGSIYDSARVRYLPSGSKNGIYDHTSEFRGLKKLVEKGFADIHSHGFTHLDPDYRRWSKAEDRNKDTRWYHEFYHVKDGNSVEKTKQFEAMSTSREKISNLFEIAPYVLTPSGHRHDAESDMLAREAGYLIFSSDYTGILKDNIIVRNWKIPSVFIYLKDPTPFTLRSGYPFVGVVHDYDIKKKGIQEFEEIIEKWRLNGIKRFISMRELALALCVSLNGYYLETESRIGLTVDMPQRSQTDSLVNGFAGTNLGLNIVLPENMMIIENCVSLLGATLLSIQHSTQTNTVEVLLKLESEPTITLNLPIQSVNFRHT
jgi:hypothetical protein